MNPVRAISTQHVTIRPNKFDRDIINPNKIPSRCAVELGMLPTVAWALNACIGK